MKRLPVGIQTFSKIVDGDYLYIDKTKEAYKLITEYEAVFLSRPRRFGKSLFLDTLHEIFNGNKKLFKGLYIYDKWDFSVSYPVIKISFAGDLRSCDSVKKRVINTLKSNSEDLELNCLNVDNPSDYFEELIKKAYKKHNQKVVILVDEYDKAILDNLDQIGVAQEIREIIKSLYSVIKDNDRYIKFAFLTGVSKFSKASIFSGLNNLEDISLNKKFGNVCGYTQKDIETTFLPYLDGVDLEKVKVWYNGYNFLKDPVYNPFDILLFIKNDFIYRDYWFETGTPTFLIKLIKENNYFLPKLSNLVVDEKLVTSFDIENLDVEVILYQAGYLTIDKVTEKRRGGIEYSLKIPNLEVKNSFNNSIIDLWFKQSNTKLGVQDNLYDSLCDENLENLKNSLIAIFSSIPTDNFRRNNIKEYEGFYASVIYVYLQSLGLDIIGEDVTNQGYIDLTVKIENIIYIIEFKMGTANALQQIKDKKYYEKYQNQGKEIYLVGINFKDKNISLFEWEKL